MLLKSAEVTIRSFGIQEITHDIKPNINCAGLHDVALL